MTVAMAVIAAVVLATAVPSAAATPDKSPMQDFETEAPIGGAFSMLTRSGTGVTTKVRTHDHGKHAYTLWYVIFNQPENCSDGVCGENDIFIGGNPDNGPDFGQIEDVRLSVVYAAGAVANPAGRIMLDGGLQEGQVPAGVGQVVIGHSDDGPLIPSPVTGLEDVMRAEIHLVLQDHGPAWSDPALRAQQTSSFMGACNPNPDSCVDPQFAVHLP